MNVTKENLICLEHVSMLGQDLDYPGSAYNKYPLDTPGATSTPGIRREATSNPHIISRMRGIHARELSHYCCKASVCYAELEQAIHGTREFSVTLAAKVEGSIHGTVVNGGAWPRWGRADKLTGGGCKPLEGHCGAAVDVLHDGAVTC